MRTHAYHAVAFIVFLSTAVAVAQTAEGLQEGEALYKEVSMQNLNIHWDIPIVDKAGIGLPLKYALHFNNNFYHVGYSDQTGLYWWTIDDTFGSSAHGWQANYDSAVAGQFQSSLGNCANKSDLYTIYTSYQDSQGNVHPFPYNGGYGYRVSDVSTATCVPASLDILLNDNSGMTVHLKGGVTGLHSTVQFRDGSIGTPADQTGFPTLSDVNGNSITTLSGQVIKDTLGVNEITVSGNDATYTYPTATGTATVTMSYKSYAVQTAFGCAEPPELSISSASFVDSIQLGDGSTYSFTYESQVPGTVTGRLASIKLPTGGTISYAYTGPNNGINCYDGTTMGLTRTTSDGTWTFTRSADGFSTTVTGPPPANNQSAYTFTAIGPGVPPFVAQRVVKGQQYCAEDRGDLLQQ